MKNHTPTSPALFVMLAVLCISLPPAGAADPPGILNQQGRISVGGANHDGPGYFKFAFVDGSGAVSYWSNDNTSTSGGEPATAVEVDVVKGHYAVPLGDTLFHPNMTNTVPTSVFTGNADVRLRTWFSTSVAGPFELLSPDRRVSSVGYALSAGEAQGVVPGGVTESMLADGAVTADKLAGASLAKLSCATNEIPIYDGSQWECGSIGGSQLNTGSISGGVSCSVDGGQIFMPGLNVATHLVAATTSYTLSQVPAGSYTLYYLKPDGSTETRAVTLAAGENLTGVNFGAVPSFYQDNDGDGFGDPAVSVMACSAPPGFVESNTDCNDSLAIVNPDAPELCDGFDNDCDGATVDGSEEPWIGVACDGPDADLCLEGTFLCSGGSQACNDTTGDNLEICNGIDDDCNGLVDDALAELPPPCEFQEGVCSGSVKVCVSGIYQTCSSVEYGPSYEPTETQCDGRDNDCDGIIDEGNPGGGVPTVCGVGACASVGMTMCVAGEIIDTCVPGMPTSEICDGIDNDCDGGVDEGLGLGVACGVGACFGGVIECDGAGGVRCSTTPGGSADQSSPEVCDGIDNNCDGTIDEGIICPAGEACISGECQPAG